MKHRRTASLILSMLSICVTPIGVAQADVSTTIQISVNLSANTTTSGSLNNLQLDAEQCTAMAVNLLELECLGAANLPTSMSNSHFEYESQLAANRRSFLLVTPI